MEKLPEEKKEYQRPELLEYENLNEITALPSSGPIDNGADSI
jgi:hypothetical protein